MEEQRLRALNEAIGKNYDALVYDPQPHPLLTLSRICGQAALFGKVARPADILDIGCGTGSQMLQVATEAAGRLHGVDISAEACNRARAKLESFGGRVTIECADFLELGADRLGQFDVIFNIGVIFVTPEPVRRKIIELIGQCLRPGGVAVLSYYAGTVPSLRANIHRLLRAATAGMPAGEAVTTSRQWLEKLANDNAETAGAELLRAAIEQSKNLPDIMLFHEALNNASEAMQTSWIERELAAYGLKFASYLPSGGMDAHAQSLERALAADCLDLAYGSYRYAVFLKDRSDATPDFRTEQVVWSSSLTRDNRGEFSGQQSFVQPDSTIQVNVTNSASTAMLDILSESPRSWNALVAETVSRVTASGLSAPDQAGMASMDADLHLVWKHGLANPNLILSGWQHAGTL